MKTQSRVHAMTLLLLAWFVWPQVAGAGGLNGMFGTGKGGGGKPLQTPSFSTPRMPAFQAPRMPTPRPTFQAPNWNWASPNGRAPAPRLPNPGSIRSVAPMSTSTRLPVPSNIQPVLRIGGTTAISPLKGLNTGVARIPAVQKSVFKFGASAMKPSSVKIGGAGVTSPLKGFSMGAARIPAAQKSALKLDVSAMKLSSPVKVGKGQFKSIPTNINLSQLAGLGKRSSLGIAKQVESHVPTKVVGSLRNTLGKVATSPPNISTLAGSLKKVDPMNRNSIIREDLRKFNQWFNGPKFPTLPLGNNPPNGVTIENGVVSVPSLSTNPNGQAGSSNQSTQDNTAAILGLVSQGLSLLDSAIANGGQSAGSGCGQDDCSDEGEETSPSGADSRSDICNDNACDDEDGNCDEVCDDDDDGESVRVTEPETAQDSSEQDDAAVVPANNKIPLSAKRASAETSRQLINSIDREIADGVKGTRNSLRDFLLSDEVRSSFLAKYAAGTNTSADVAEFRSAVQSFDVKTIGQLAKQFKVPSKVTTGITARMHLSLALQTLEHCAAEKTSSEEMISSYTSKCQSELAHSLLNKSQREIVGTVFDELFRAMKVRSLLTKTESDNTEGYVDLRNQQNIFVFYPPLAPAGEVFYMPGGVLAFGEAAEGPMQVGKALTSEILGIAQSQGKVVSNVSEDACRQAAKKIVIRCPKEADSGLTYTLNGYSYEIKPGYTQELDGNQAWTIAFSRGSEDGEEVSYELDPGKRYAFSKTAKGWDLHSKPEEVTLTNPSRNGSIQLVVMNQKVEIPAQQSLQLTTENLVSVAFDRGGYGGVLYKELSGGNYFFAADKASGHWELFREN
jgi:hypothetical protein